MFSHNSLSNHGLVEKIRRKEITMGGNRKLKIYGLLSCRSGKRTKKQTGCFLFQKPKLYKMAIGLVQAACGNTISNGSL